MADEYHTTEDDFQHFLTYTGLRLDLDMRGQIPKLRLAFYAGANVPPPTGDEPDDPDAA